MVQLALVIGMLTFAAIAAISAFNLFDGRYYRRERRQLQNEFLNFFPDVLTVKIHHMVNGLLTEADRLNGYTFKGHFAATIVYHDGEMYQEEYVTCTAFYVDDEIKEII